MARGETRASSLLRRPQPALRWSVELLRAGFEGGDHAVHRLVEQHADQLLQHRRAELEVDIEIDAAAAVRVRLEAPVVGEVLERAVGIGDVDGEMLGRSSMTRLVKRSRIILKPMMRSATSSVSLRSRMRAPMHQGRNSG